MRNKKKIFSLLVVGISAFGASASLAFVNKQQNQKQISSKFVKNNEVVKENNIMLSIISNHKKCVFCNQLIKKAVSSQLNRTSGMYSKQMVLLSSQALNQEERIDKLSKEIILYQQENENNSSLEQLELLKQKKKQLESAWNKQKLIKLKQQKLKNVLLGASVGGAIVAGITAGLSSFFGLRNINSQINSKIKELKENILYEQDLISKIKNKDSLFDVFKKLVDISFKKDFPKAIFEVIDSFLLKTLLKDFVTNSTSSELKNILENNIKDITTKLVDELLNKIESIKLKTEEQEDEEVVEDKNIDEIIKELQKNISEVTKNYLPNFIKGVIKFLVKIDNSNNNKKKVSQLLF